MRFPTGSRWRSRATARSITWPSQGKTTQKLERHRRGQKQEGTGTLITFQPDPTIFTITTEFKFERLATRLRELAFLNPGLEITLTDERAESPKKETFLYKHGIEEFVKQLGENKQVLHPKPIVIARQRDEVFVDVVLQYNDSYNDQILLLRQLDSQSGRRHASDRLPHRADPRDQPVRASRTIC